MTQLALLTLPANQDDQRCFISSCDRPLYVTKSWLQGATYSACKEHAKALEKVRRYA